MRVDTGTMEDILVKGVNESVASASRTLSSLISLLHRNRRSEIAERLQAAQQGLNGITAVMSGIYGDRRA